MKLWHWAHKTKRNCDPWWENETEWHRTWKGQFPESWQEVMHFAENGEKHIADVKTDQGWIIEFQHSRISSEERLARDSFYKKLVWVVDGTRRKRDLQQFQNAVNSGMRLKTNLPVCKVRNEGCAILRDWARSNGTVFLDFGPEKNLWWILKENGEGWAYVAPFSRSNFIGMHLGGGAQQAQEFDAFTKDIGELVAKYEAQFLTPQVPQAIQLPVRSVQPYPLFRRRSRRRL